MSAAQKYSRSHRAISPLFRWRMSKGWVQEEAAAHLGIDVGAYCTYERGLKLPKPPRMREIEQKTGGQVTKLAYLLFYHRITDDELRHHLDRMQALKELMAS